MCIRDSNRSHIGAHVVKAEVHAVHAKLCDSCHGSNLNAHTNGAGEVHTTHCSCQQCALHWQNTRMCYEKVLEAPQQLGSCSERYTVRYNYACALAMSGGRQEALGLLQGVAGKHPEALAGADRDAELRNLWNSHEFQALLPGLRRN